MVLVNTNENLQKTNKKHIANRAGTVSGSSTVLSPAEMSKTKMKTNYELD